MTTYKCTRCDNNCVLTAPNISRVPWLCPLKGVTIQWEQVEEETDSIRQDVEKLIEKYENDVVNHPNHYVEGRKYEPVDVAEDWGLDRDAYLFNVFTYIARAGRKDDIVQDLEKARWYLDRRIKCLKEERDDVE